MKEPYRKGSSESILTSSLAGDTARCRLKRRQRHWWAGLLSFEKPMEQDADSIPRGGRQPSAEVGEGRARAVENIVRSHMLPTQSGNCMSQGTGGVRQAILPQLIHGKSRMRRRARTDLCGGRSVMVVPTATDATHDRAS